MKSKHFSVTSAWHDSADVHSKCCEQQFHLQMVLNRRYILSNCKAQTLHKSVQKHKFPWHYLDYGVLECDTEIGRYLPAFQENPLLPPSKTETGGVSGSFSSCIHMSQTTWPHIQENCSLNYTKCLTERLWFSKYKLVYSIHFQFFNTKGVLASYSSSSNHLPSYARYHNPFICKAAEHWTPNIV